jgi:hypothetical protein
LFSGAVAGGGATAPEFQNSLFSNFLCIKLKLSFSSITSSHKIVKNQISKPRSTNFSKHFRTNLSNNMKYQNGRELEKRI